MTLRVLFFIYLISPTAGASAPLTVLNTSGTYEIELDLPKKQTVQLSCTRPHVRTGSLCTTEIGSMAIGDCAKMDKAYNVECVKSIYDAQKTQGLIDQIQKASIESLTSAVKDSYRTLVTSKDFQKIVREEVQRALAEQNGER